jgi:FKBP-type peptidyl-prolyl cis-trans isomerase
VEALSGMMNSAFEEWMATRENNRMKRKLRAEAKEAEKKEKPASMEHKKKQKAVPKKQKRNEKKSSEVTAVEGKIQIIECTSQL